MWKNVKRTTWFENWSYTANVFGTIKVGLFEKVRNESSIEENEGTNHIDILHKISILNIGLIFLTTKLKSDRQYS